MNVHCVPRERRPWVTVLASSLTLAHDDGFRTVYDN